MDGNKFKTLLKTSLSVILLRGKVRKSLRKSSKQKNCTCVACSGEVPC